MEHHAPALADGLAPSTPIRCAALHCTLPARVCLARQAVSRRQRTCDVWRGQGSDFPSCRRCSQGAALEESLGAAGVAWRGCGAGGRTMPLRTRHDCDAQERARERLELVGALEPVPSVDEPPEEEAEDERPAVLAP